LKLYEYRAVVQGFFSLTLFGHTPEEIPRLKPLWRVGSIAGFSEIEDYLFGRKSRLRKGI